MVISATIMTIENLKLDSPTWSTSQLGEIWYNLGKIGDSISENSIDDYLAGSTTLVDLKDRRNYYFLLNYRYWNKVKLEGVVQTALDAKSIAGSIFPQTVLPGEKDSLNSTLVWGCSYNIWQRYPKETCNESNTEYDGMAFFNLYTLIKNLQ